MSTLTEQYRAWRGGPMPRRAEAAWLLDELLDQVPRYEDGRWHRYGRWGCRIGLERYWDRFTAPGG